MKVLRTNPIERGKSTAQDMVKAIEAKVALVDAASTFLTQVGPPLLAGDAAGVKAAVDQATASGELTNLMNLKTQADAAVKTAQDFKTQNLQQQ